MDNDKKAKTLKLREQVDYLLQPIGMKVANYMGHWHSLSNHVGPFRLINANSSIEVVCDREPLSPMTVFGSINRVIDQLGKIRSFHLYCNKDGIENPYYRCTCLEEMLLKRDWTWN